LLGCGHQRCCGLPVALRGQGALATLFKRLHLIDHISDDKLVMSEVSGNWRLMAIWLAPPRLRD
jgi:hypothetical protein